MAIVKINALSVPPQAGDELVRRFSARLDELSHVEGFEGFELLKPTGDAETRWFVYTRWADEDAYQAWRNSETFARGHAQPSPGTAPQGHPHNTADNAASNGGSSGGPGPMSTGATLLEFDVAVAASPADS